MICMLFLILGIENYSKQGLEDQVRQWIMAQAPLEGELFVSRIFVPTLRNVPQGVIEYQIQPRSQSQTLLGRNSLRVDLLVDGRLYKTLMVQTETELETLVGVVTNDIARGETISDSDISWEVQRVGRLTSALITPEDLAPGLQARTLLRSGSVLDRRKVETVPLVLRGRMATVVARLSGMTVQMQAKALDDGAAGDEIRLKNVDSGQLLMGRVEANGEVTLIL